MTWRSCMLHGVHMLRGQNYACASSVGVVSRRDAAKVEHTLTHGPTKPLSICPLQFACPLLCRASLTTLSLVFLPPPSRKALLLQVISTQRPQADAALRAPQLARQPKAGCCSVGNWRPSASCACPLAQLHCLAVLGQRHGCGSRQGAAASLGRIAGLDEQRQGQDGHSDRPGRSSTQKHCSGPFLCIHCAGGLARARHASPRTLTWTCSHSSLLAFCGHLTTTPSSSITSRLDSEALAAPSSTRPNTA